MSRRAAVLAIVGLVVGLVGCDHATKRVAEVELRGREAVTIVDGVVDLRYAENRGVAFNLDRWAPAAVTKPVVFTVAGLALVILGVMWWRRRGEISATTAGYACVAAGTLGNLVDRIVRGYVIDFIHVRHWPVFNVADVAIGVGVGLILLGGWRARGYRREPDSA